MESWELLKKIAEGLSINKELMQELYNHFPNMPIIPLGLPFLDIFVNEANSSMREVYFEYTTRDDKVYGKVRSSIRVSDLGKKGKTVIFDVDFEDYPNDLVQLIHLKWESKGYKGMPHLETKIESKFSGRDNSKESEVVYSLSNIILCELKERYDEHFKL